MIVDTAEAKCVMNILSILLKKKSRYNELFKITRASHTTLQKVLLELEFGEFIIKEKTGIKQTSYSITSKGEELLNQLLILEEFLSKF